MICGAIAAALQLFLVRTRFGAQLRAAVDDARVANGLGIDVDRISPSPSRSAAGLRASAGRWRPTSSAASTRVSRSSSWCTFLIVVTIGGSNGILGALFGALLLGVLDVAGKYYVPSIGAFIIYAVMVVTLIVRPAGPVRARGRPMSAAPQTTRRIEAHLARRAPLALSEIVFWLAVLAIIVALPSRAALINEILVAGLFALSLDLILGLAGIVSLGQAAFLGVGAYAAAILASQGYADPTLGLAVGARVAARARLRDRAASAARRRPHPAHGDARRVAAARRARQPQRLADRRRGRAQFLMGPVLGLFPIGFTGQRNAALYSFVVLFVLFALARSAAPVAVRAGAGGDPREPAERRRARHRHRLAHRRDLYAFRRPTPARPARCSPQTTQIVSLDLFDFHRSADVMLMLIIGGAGWLYGGIVGAARVHRAARRHLRRRRPEYWEFWIGLAAGDRWCWSAASGFATLSCAAPPLLSPKSARGGAA